MATLRRLLFGEATAGFSSTRCAKESVTQSRNSKYFSTAFGRYGASRVVGASLGEALSTVTRISERGSIAQSIAQNLPKPSQTSQIAQLKRLVSD